MKTHQFFLQLAAAAILVALLVLSVSAQSKCAETAAVVKPQLSEKAEELYNAKLAEASADYVNNAKNADAIIWLGRRHAYLGSYKRAIEIFTEGIVSYPKDPRFYRHRGHRFISIRCFDDAVKDFETAAKLIEGKPDEIEPDGLPNARNIPTSTLQSNIWYHLGLAYYLKGDFKNALRAYRECIKVSKNPDMLVATTNWLYATLRRLNKPKEAALAIQPIKDDLDIIENDGYYKLIKVFQGKISADELLNEIGKSGDSLNDASVGYGLGNWFLINGDKDKANKIFSEISSGDQWSSFGFIAAEAELKR
ncbi:MAG: tetratricopeptide repeat protein [Pyrinomonadaceae bacterium]